jgi:cytochrome c oxidase subunit IV
MDPDQQPGTFGQRHGVTILTAVIAILFILVCIVQVRT